MRKVPTLSFRAYTDGEDSDKRKFIEQFFSGLKDYGFVVLTEHIVESELLTRAYDTLKEFFDLPVETKMRYAKVHGGQRGYTPFGKEHAKNSNVIDLKEFWHIGRQVDSGHQFSKYYPDNVWPDEIPEFKPIFEDLYSRLEETGNILLQALAWPLDVPNTYFDNMTEDGNSILRLLHYPAIPAGTDPRCLRAAPHEDINLITLLPAATASGLQLKDRDGQWLDIDSAHDSLIVDSADMLSRITNELIPSTTHQVINTSRSSSESRYSMPFFMHPNPEAILSCLPSCRGEGEKYLPITANDFLMERLLEIGLTAKEAKT